MAKPSTEIRVSDAKGRLTLPRSFANATLLLEIRSENEIVLRKAKVVPLEEVFGKTQEIKLSERDWNLVMDLMENPPEPTAALKDLMQNMGPWQPDDQGRTHFTLPKSPKGMKPAKGRKPRRSPKQS